MVTNLPSTGIHIICDIFFFQTLRVDGAGW